jgi:hypothetical protein
MATASASLVVTVDVHCVLERIAFGEIVFGGI